MGWNAQQEATLRDVDRWLRDPRAPQVYRLFGYAGTGKTTLAKHFASGLDGGVYFGAYTGKAAHVLQQKGCPGASTIHSLIYRSKEKGKAKLKDLEEQYAQLLQELRAEDPDLDPRDHRRAKELRSLMENERKELARPMFELNDESPLRGAKLAVFDECSMIDATMGEDILSFGCKVLVLGDPAQLPPVAGAGFFTEGVEPDTMLTDIRRQARDNPIIDMATRVRQEEPLPVGPYGNSRVVPGHEIGPDDALGADQVLVGRNKTRRASNRRVRSLLGHNDALPQPGDRLVCLRNNHDMGLLNGAIWYCSRVDEHDSDQAVLTVKPEDGGDEVVCYAHLHHFQGRSEELPFWERKDAEEFDYGYALTVHKSQGSQWDNVMLFDESWCFRQDKWRWLYTGITRAAEQLTVVKM
jgi:exodeoxyribonuclease-5